MWCTSLIIAKFENNPPISQYLSHAKTIKRFRTRNDFRDLQKCY